MAKASDNQFPSVLFTEQGSAPAGPAAGDQRLFIDSADNHLKRVDSADAVVDIEAAGAPTDAAYIVGAADGDLSAEVVKAYLADNYDPDAYPAVPDALDDEFEGGGALDVKWTAANDPAGADALNQTDYEGCLHVGLAELGTDDWANLVQLYQTAPAGAATMEFVAKISLAIVADGYQTDGGEFAGVGIALINSTNSQAVGMGLQFNIGALTWPLITLAFEDNFSGFGTTQPMAIAFPGQWIWVKLKKSTANAYTSANTYNMYVSGNGIVWQHVASGSKTFTTACDRVGLLFRRPKSQTGTPKAETLVDCFRKTA